MSLVDPRKRRAIRGGAATEYIIAAIFIGITGIVCWKAFGKTVSCHVALATQKLNLGSGANGGTLPESCSSDDSGGAVASNDPPPGSSSGSAGPTPGTTCVDSVCTQPGKCFVAGTLVLTEDGLRPIESLRVGMRVWSRDQEGDAADWKPITETFANISLSLVQLTVVGVNGKEEELDVTPSHNLFVQGRGWVEAGTLTPEADVLVDASGAPLFVRAVNSLDSHVPVYNLDVADFHTYFVGEHGLWAHNRIHTGDRIPINIGGVPGVGHVVRNNGDGTYNWEATVNGQNYSGRVNRDGRGVTVYPLRPSHHYGGGTINGMPVQNAPPLPGPTTVGQNIIIPSPPQQSIPLHDPYAPAQAASHRQNTLNDLNTLASGNSGSRLLTSIDSVSGRPITIRYADGFHTRAQTNPDGTGTNMLPGGMRNSGGGAILDYNSSLHGGPLYEDNDPRAADPAGIGPWNDAVLDSSRQGWGQAYNKPPYMVLGHELMHANDMQRGVNDPRSMPQTWGRNAPSVPGIGEQRAVGLGPFAGGSYNENTIREEHYLPPRTSYSGRNEVYPDDTRRGYPAPDYYPPQGPPLPPPSFGAPFGYCP